MFAATWEGSAYLDHWVVCAGCQYCRYSKFASRVGLPNYRAFPFIQVEGEDILRVLESPSPRSSAAVSAASGLIADVGMSSGPGVLIARGRPPTEIQTLGVMTGFWACDTRRNNLNCVANRTPQSRVSFA
jgi:hypothetical protein